MIGSMMKAAIAFLIAAILASPAMATPQLDPVFGNTLEMTYPDGRLARLWLDRDGSYRGVNWHGRTSSGRWFVKPGKVCMKQKRPLPMPISFCTPLVAGSVGAAWGGRAVSGEPIRIRLVAGR